VRGPFAPRQTGPAVPREGGAAFTPARAMPLLRVWETKRLLLHEEADAARVRRLADALRRDGVLRNPPIVAALPDGRAIVLDGANRVTALCTLRVPHAVVQSVSYDNPNVRLSLWRHYVPKAVPGALRAAAEALGSTAPVSDEADAESQIAAGDGIAAIIDARGGAVLRRAGRPAAGHHEIKAGGAVAAAAALGRFVALYRDGRAVHRVDAGTLEELRAAYGDGALVLFRRFEKLDILTLAVEGGRLPAGITRHVIPGRALRLNTPLAWLADGIDVAVKQAALEAQLQQRWQAYGVRYYAEPTFLFDE
jgi:L-serine kinase (ATP) / ParB family transcriptional regulator, heme-responsive regulator